MVSVLLLPVLWSTDSLFLQNHSLFLLSLQQAGSEASPVGIAGQHKDVGKADDALGAPLLVHYEYSVLALLRHHLTPSPAFSLPTPHPRSPRRVTHPLSPRRVKHPLSLVHAHVRSHPTAPLDPCENTWSALAKSEASHNRMLQKEQGVVGCRGAPIREDPPQGRPSSEEKAQDEGQGLPYRTGPYCTFPAHVWQRPRDRRGAGRHLQNLAEWGLRLAGGNPKRVTTGVRPFHAVHLLPCPRLIDPGSLRRYAVHAGVLPDWHRQSGEEVWQQPSQV